jgi:hypothetical protein
MKVGGGSRSPYSGDRATSYTSDETQTFGAKTGFIMCTEPCVHPHKGRLGSRGRSQTLGRGLLRAMLR